MLTQKTLKELLHYNLETGVFTWIRARKGVRKNRVAGYKERQGYIQIGINGKLYRAHRLAFLYVNGEFPENDTDHINHNRGDNRWVNIRSVTRQENMMNSTMYSTNTSGFAGVEWCKNKLKWRAKVEIDGKKISFGLFFSKEDAEIAVTNGRLKLGFHANHGR